MVNWNRRDLLLDCIEHLESIGHDLADVVVVDNGSSDGSVLAVRTRYPAVTVFRSGENRGFAWGTNQILKATEAKTILLLNPDARPAAGAITILNTYLMQNSDVAAVGPVLTDETGRFMACHDKFPNLGTTLSQLLRLQRGPHKHDVPTEADWIGGSCLMLSSRAVRDVGEFDTSYFMYSEELDWCRRARERGWRIICLPNATAIHFEGGSGTIRRRAQISRSKIDYHSRYSGPVSAVALAVALVVYHGFSAGVWAIVGGWSSMHSESHRLAATACRQMLASVVRRSIAPQQ